MGKDGESVTNAAGEVVRRERASMSWTVAALPTLVGPNPSATIRGDRGGTKKSSSFIRKEVESSWEAQEIISR